MVVKRHVTGSEFGGTRDVQDLEIPHSGLDARKTPGSEGSTAPLTRRPVFSTARVRSGIFFCLRDRRSPNPRSEHLLRRR